MVMAAIALMGACHSKAPEEQPAPIDTTPIIEEVYEEPVVEEPIAKPARRRIVQPKKEAPKEVYYVTSYDAKGPVWGHITMTGDTGTGVIHDSEENTFTVSGTRHGDELFAVDQNSRQYVFKLNNRTK